MPIDFSSIDLFALIPKNNWTEEEKIEFLQTFSQAFGVYIVSELSQKVSEETDQELTKLLESRPTLEQIETFYNGAFPNLEGTFFTKAVEFKKIFLIALYTKKLSVVTKLQRANNRSSIEQVKLDAAVGQWQSLIEYAQNDNWDNVIHLLETFKQSDPR